VLEVASVLALSALMVGLLPEFASELVPESAAGSVPQRLVGA
jgi:hypothetical protein